MYKKVIVLIFSLAALIGCQSAPPIYQNESLSLKNAGLVKVYMPKWNFVGAALDYRVTINDQYRGSVKRGKSLSTFVKPGKAKIRVQGFYYGSANSDYLEGEIDVAQGEVLHLRYAGSVNPLSIRDTGIKAGYANVYTMEFKSKIQPVSEDVFDARK